MSNSSRPTHIEHSPWPHRWAVVLTCATFPLIWIGGLVTTTDAGMAVPDWPTTYGYNLFLYPWSAWIFGPWDLFIEHGHRLLGAAVGLIAIGLLLVLRRAEPRRWVQVFGLVLLLAVIGQGVLGGLRVRMDERALAMLHGCSGPVFFVFCVAMAVVTSRRWRERKPNASSPVAKRVMPLAGATALVAYLQLVVGAQLRHMPATGEPRLFQAAVHLHLLLAAVVLLHAAWLALSSRRIEDDRWLTRGPLELLALVVLQLSLGAGTWLFHYGAPAWVRQWTGEWDFAVAAGSYAQSLIATAHVAVGSLIVAVAVAVCLRLARAGRGAGETMISRHPAVEAAV